ncbi:MAG: hypothetical protein P4L84_11365 [Isosphaeraceae bacterium]|nr:hypothetical protein [Isosphaeraceae bacterium]
MDQKNVYPDEEWWERTLLRSEKENGSVRERSESNSGKDADHASLPSFLSDGAFDCRSNVPAFWALDVRDPEYALLAASAQEFIEAVQLRSDLPHGCESLAPAALRVAAHLAGGHGMGYEDSVLCGNIVRCRWALAECRFCAETLAHIVSRLGRPEFAGLLDRCRTLSNAIEERIDQLRRRVWW